MEDLSYSTQAPWKMHPINDSITNACDFHVTLIMNWFMNSGFSQIAVKRSLYLLLHFSLNVFYYAIILYPKHAKHILLNLKPSFFYVPLCLFLNMQ